MILGISTSQSITGIVLAEQDSIINSIEFQAIGGEKYDIGSLFTKLLAESNRQLTDIRSIVVDIGPGGTSSVRTGVAFANGLAYCLKVPILGLSSIEIIGLEVYRKTQLPVVVSMPSIKGNFYWGIYDNELVSIQYGPLENLVRSVESTYKNIALAGYNKSPVPFAGHFRNCEVTDSMGGKADISFAVRNVDKFSGKFSEYPNLPVPLTELTIPHEV